MERKHILSFIATLLRSGRFFMKIQKLMKSMILPLLLSIGFAIFSPAANAEVRAGFLTNQGDGNFELADVDGTWDVYASNEDAEKRLSSQTELNKTYCASISGEGDIRKLRFHFKDFTIKKPQACLSDKKLMAEYPQMAPKPSSSSETRCGWFNADPGGLTLTDKDGGWNLLIADGSEKILFPKNGAREWCGCVTGETNKSEMAFTSISSFKSKPNKACQ
uniref:DUF4087 domain-containing protein n=1 Tax=Castellaniella defragrans TaxID=75697 RepID=UPI00333E26C3